MYVFELDAATQAYGLTGIFHNRLKVTAPFPVDIDLTAIDRRRVVAPEPSSEAQ